MKRRVGAVLRKVVFSSTVGPSFSVPLSVGSDHGLVGGANPNRGGGWMPQVCGIVHHTGTRL